MRLRFVVALSCALGCAGKVSELPFDAGEPEPDAGSDDAGVLDGGATGPVLATLFGGRSATTGTAFSVRVVLDRAATQPQVITWTASNAGVLSSATTLIAVGQTRASVEITWAAAGAGRTVDFTIEPTLARAGNPLTVDVSDLAVPSWVQSAPVGEWRQLASTAAPHELRDYAGLAWRDDATGLEAWSGANGGHGGNLTNNRVMSLRLDVEAPAWVERKPASDATGWDTVGTRPYMADGTPAPRHTYWYNWWVPQLGRVYYLRLG